MCKQCEFARSLRITWPAAQVMLFAAREMPRQERAKVVTDARELTGDDITSEIAVNLMMCYVERIGIPIQRGNVATFTITTPDGEARDPDKVEPHVVTTARMVTAIAAADLLAARDVFRAFAAEHPDRVTEFLLGAVDGALGEDTR